MSNKKYLNLGCGNHYHPLWTNIDFSSTGPGVIAYNLLDGIPYDDDSFDVVYHSHVLEHFPKNKALPFISECYRVLKPGGIIRIAIPDLEQIIRCYLNILNDLSQAPDSEELSNNYNWILLEMYDQTIRNKSGGEMMTYLSQSSIDFNFVIKRCGQEVTDIINNLKNYQNITAELSKPPKVNLLKELYYLIRYSNRKERLIKILLKDDYRALEIGRFRLKGEIHQWMYDKYSMKRLLIEAMFKNITVKSAFESDIENWTSFELESNKEGNIRKPDSLFIEAVKTNYE